MSIISTLIYLKPVLILLKYPLITLNYPGRGKQKLSLVTLQHFVALSGLTVISAPLLSHSG